MMHVYAIKAQGSYAGGMAIVAAHSEDQAKSLATGIDHEWHTRYHDPCEIKVLPVMSDVEYPCVIIHFEYGE